MLTATLAGWGCERPKELRVPLDYRPTDTLQVTGVSLPPDLRLAVTAVDARTDTSAIGRNTEHESEPVPIYTAQRTPDDFLRDAASRAFASAGITVVPDRSQANKTLQLTLKRFWADETNTYRSTILAEAELKDASGARLWQGQATGTNQRFGRSLKAENYDEVFSDAVVDLGQNLLRNDAFVSALRAERAPSRPAARTRRPGSH